MHAAGLFRMGVDIDRHKIVRIEQRQFRHFGHPHGRMSGRTIAVASALVRRKRINKNGAALKASAPAALMASMSLFAIQKWCSLG
jgi:hypothetical protein